MGIGAEAPLSLWPEPPVHLSADDVSALVGRGPMVWSPIIGWFCPGISILGINDLVARSIGCAVPGPGPSWVTRGSSPTK